MSHTLVIDLPDEVYDPLTRRAQEAGQTPEEFAAQWVVTRMAQLEEDPLERFIGAFPSNVPDWTDRHDHYMGQHLEAEMREEER